MTRGRPAVRWHSWLVRALAPFVPRARRLDWTREWEAELESRERELLAWGLVPRRASWRVFREGTGAVWDALWLQSARWEDEVIQDIRFGLRLLRRSPWLSGTAIASLAIGIGATTAVFTVINAALFRALPYPAVERLIAVTQGESRYLSLPEYRELHAGVTTLEHLSAIETRDFVMGEGDSHPEQVRGQRVSASFATLVGLDSTLAPVLGRVFAASDFGGPLDVGPPEAALPGLAPPPRRRRPQSTQRSALSTTFRPCTCSSDRDSSTPWGSPWLPAATSRPATAAAGSSSRSSIGPSPTDTSWMPIRLAGASGSRQ